MASDSDLDPPGLPEPGPPFQIGDRVAFFPAELGPHLYVDELGLRSDRRHQ
jgi:hypothetical protein